MSLTNGMTASIRKISTGYHQTNTSTVGEIQEKIDPKIAEIESSLIMYSKIKKILWASGDKKEPRVDTIQYMHRFVEELLSLLYHSRIMYEVIKWQNPMISKRFKLRKLLKYLLKLFPVETCTFFSSVEIKKSIKSGKVKKKKSKADSTHGNPVLELEKLVKSPEYDKYREKHQEIKVMKATFNSNRIRYMSEEEMKSLEKCKEERLYTERFQEKFLNLIQTCCKMNIDFVMSKKIVFDFTSYIISIQIRHLVHDALRKLNPNGELRECSRPLQVEDLRPIVEKKLEMIKRLQDKYIKKFSNRIENEAFRTFKSELEEYLDIYLVNNPNFMKYRLVKENDEIKFASVIRELHRCKFINDERLAELLVSPENIWNYLSPKLKNIWIERIIVKNQFFKKLRLRLKSLTKNTFRKTFKYQLKSLGRDGCFTFGYHLRELIEECIDYKRPWLILENTAYKILMKKAFRSYFLVSVYNEISSTLIGKYSNLEFNKFCTSPPEEENPGCSLEESIHTKYLNLSQRRKKGLLRRTFKKNSISS